MDCTEAGHRNSSGAPRGALLPLLAGLALLGIAGPARALDVNPVDCLTRSTQSIGRTTDTVNSSPADGPETGNRWRHHDTFALDTDSECFFSQVLGVSISVKNPFDIPGPDDLNATTFPDLVDELEMNADFEDFDHWSGWSLPAPDANFVNNQDGFHGVSICLFFGEDVGNASNVDDCLSGAAERLILQDVDGMGMRFSIDLDQTEDAFYLEDGESEGGIGTFEGTEFGMVTLVYSDTYGNTVGGQPFPNGRYAHPEAVVGWQFVPLVVPEPSTFALLATALAGLAWRGRARP